MNVPKWYNHGLFHNTLLRVHTYIVVSSLSQVHVLIPILLTSSLTLIYVNPILELHMALRVGY